MAMDRTLGVKAYGYDWCNQHGLDMAGAARRLEQHGIDVVLLQNLIDPLPGSAVLQQPPAGAYDDRGLRDEIGACGLKVYESTSAFFDPDDFRCHPHLRPVAADGSVFEPVGWYVGVCPTDPARLARKAELIAEVTDRIRPDGIFLSFIRFPNFWELWMPETERAQITEYCFCARCLHRFSEETGHQLPEGDTAAAARILQHELRPQWTMWKCAVIADAAARLRAAAQQVDPAVTVMLNGFGLGTADYDNAVEEVLGQRFAELDPHVDVYELMFYFQIQRRDPGAWIPQRIADARARSRRPLLACLQGGPEYLEAMYASGRRSSTITDLEWEGALRAVAAARADGVMVYSWRDLLNDEAAGGSRVRSLLRYKEGAL